MGLQRIRLDLMTGQQQEASSCQWLFNCCYFSAGWDEHLYSDYAVLTIISRSDFIFWSFIKFLTVLSLLFVLVFWPPSMWDLSFLTRGQTHTPCIGRQSLTHWTTKEVPRNTFSMSIFSYIFHIFCSIL